MADDAIHVFVLALPLDRAFALPDPRLSAEENGRAARFVFAIDRARYVASHLGLRHVLGACLHTDGAAVRFDPAVPALGKPRLAQGDGDVRFNLSHAGALALIAVARGREVGVDVEVEAAIDKTALLPLLSPAEVNAIATLSPEDQRLALRRIWPRKEAYVKACGLGLSAVLADFDVTVAADARLLATRPDPREALRWVLTALPAPPGYSAALVYEGPAAKVTIQELPAAFL